MIKSIFKLFKKRGDNQIEKIISLKKSGASKLTIIRMIAETNNFNEIDHQDRIGLISFKKEGVRINVYYTKMTVGTCLSHPRQGKTQLFRKGVSMNCLDKIFKNPRLHTGKGYRKK
jgi:hypothetical protein